MGTDECLLQEMSVLCRKVILPSLKRVFFLSSSMSSVEPWIKCASPRVVIPAWIRKEFGIVSARGHYWILPGAAVDCLDLH